MAIKLNDRYPGRANPSSVDYPQGSFKNRTSPTAKDGTYLEQDWANDNQGFLQSILSYFGVTANGQVDKVGSSQYFDAITSNPTETRKGMPQVATQAQANAGADDSTIVTPKKLRAGFSISLTANGYIAFPTWMTGLIIQWGSANGSASDSQVVTYPVMFPTGTLSVVATASNPSGHVATLSSNPSAQSFSFDAWSISNTPVRTIAAIRWIAIGY